MTHQNPHKATPFTVPSSKRWQISPGKFATFQVSSDKRSIRVFTREVKNAGKCGNLLKIRWAPERTDVGTLTNATANAILAFVVTHRVRRAVHLDQREDGRFDVSLDSDPNAHRETLDASSPSEMRAALLRLLTLTDGVDGTPSPEALSLLNEKFASHTPS